MQYQNQRNPVLPLACHVPDGEAHVMPDGALYVYGSWDDGEKYYCSGEYHVAWTRDMKTWHVEDAPSLRAEDVPWAGDPDAPKYPGIDWAHPTPFILRMLEMDRAGQESAEDGEEKKAEIPEPGLLYAPDCICRDGRYYLYFCMSDDSEGVAVSDSPRGPFLHPVQLPCGGIDPAIFVDRDGSAYYYWGQLFSHGVKLNPDMMSFSREQVADNLVTEETHFFHEGSSMRRIGDTYYYVYACMERGRPTALGYATSSSPLGPFRYRGIIVDNALCDPESWNNHGSIECFQGQWYVFYHRSSRGSRIHRRLCVEKIRILPDGTIPEVRMTSQGAGDPLGPGERIMGYQACEVHGGCRIDADAEYGEVLTGLKAGSRAVFRYVKSRRAWTGVRVQACGSGTLRLLMSGREAGRVSMDGDVDAYRETEGALSMEEGEYELEIEVVSADRLRIASLELF